MCKLEMLPHTSLHCVDSMRDQVILGTSKDSIWLSFHTWRGCWLHIWQKNHSEPVCASERISQIRHCWNCGKPSLIWRNFTCTEFRIVGFLGGSTGKNLPAMWETWVWSLGWEDPLEKGATTRYNVLTWTIPCSVWPMRLQSAHRTERLYFHFHCSPVASTPAEHRWAVPLCGQQREWWHARWLPCPGLSHSSVLAWGIPGTGEPAGLPSMGSRRVGHNWSDLAAAAAWLFKLLCGFVYYMDLKFLLLLYTQISVHIP